MQRKCTCRLSISDTVKRRDKTKVFPNSSGLHVSLSLTGEVTFFNRYCWEGKPVQLTIGDYPSRSPSQARKRRQQFRRWVTEKYNPGCQVFHDRLQKWWQSRQKVKIHINRRSFLEPTLAVLAKRSEPND
ncbi:Arm DNA-binding domain-containing protein [Pantoea vagans]|uniref:Arm DNA-binding domain-containing protein n=1 Tax=Pantoea vagans TaxID=470934 RepID=UPI0022562B6B|nr:Arm DNA-binding domain-containing protein [Pantoea vagans]MCX3307934.1 Arm DNA-binding domain-containing protein [Pantoea vagans]